MNIDQQPINPERIAGLLTRATEQLDGNTVTALRRARNIALERQAQAKPVLALSTGHHTHWLTTHSIHQWVVASILFMAVLVGYIGYLHHENENEISQTDVALLTDEMPLEVFVDR